MPSVCFMPKFQENAIGGVGYVVALLRKYLSSYGWEVTEDPQGADIVHGHAVSSYHAIDVYTNHGVYPATKDTPAWQQRGNRVISQNFKIADEITTVSRWTASQWDWWEGIDPHIIYNFIDVSEWESIEGHFQAKKPYALWAKIKPYQGLGEAIRLAAQNPSHNFVFTLAPIPVTPNVTVTGILPFDQMRLALKDCSVYLSLSAVDNFPLQVLEAMVLGKPILAFATGGVPEAVRHEQDGYIIYDINEAEIQKGFEYCLKHADRLGKNAKQRVKDWFSVEKIIPQYVEIYESILSKRRTRKRHPKCSIVITTHNFEEYVKECIDSALAQDHSSFEVVVVDDGSTDGTWDIIKSYGRKVRSKRFKKSGGKIHGIIRSRNTGVQIARGEFISCLDGDDKITSNFLSELAPVLENNQTLGIAYSDFEVFGITEAIIKTPKFDFERLKRGNYIPCCNLFRKKAWNRVGGSKPVGESWEDYNVWLSMTERGWGAKQHPGVLFQYRKKGDKGRDFESQPFVQRLRAVINAYHPMILPPFVSVVIPCYGHEKYLKEAIDSVFAQTYQNFEIVIVNDGSLGDPDKIVNSYWDPRIRMIAQENKGLSSARNLGIERSRGRFILPLDADDKLHPELLEKAVKVQEKYNGRVVVYSDFIAFWDDGSESLEVLVDYDFQVLLEKAMMPCTILYPKRAWRQVEGYKSAMVHGYEDWEFSISLGEKGFRGVRIPEHLFYYRQHDDSMRNKMSEDDKKDARRVIRELHPALFPSPVVKPPPREVLKPGMVKLRYTGKQDAPISYRGYQVSASHPFVFVPSDRINELLRVHFERA